jgi:hypothetical protein
MLHAHYTLDRHNTPSGAWTYRHRLGRGVSLLLFFSLLFLVLDAKGGEN